ncbi:hypothetical protein V1506DRAFT_509404 [Lipomyces tetrasporus]
MLIENQIQDVDKQTHDDAAVNPNYTCSLPETLAKIEVYMNQKLSRSEKKIEEAIKDYFEDLLSAGKKIESSLKIAR